MNKLLTKGTLALSLLGLLASTVLFQAQAASESLPAETSCTIPSEQPLAASQSAGRMESYAYQDWLSKPAAQDGVAIINQALDARLGNPDKGEDPLRAGLIGIGADHYSQELVVVVDPALVDRETLEGTLSALVADTPLNVRVNPSCNSASELIAARTVIEGARWNPAASKAPRAYFLDDATSTWNVSFAERDRLVGDSLKLALGDSVTIEWGEPTRDGRLNDGEPHWGGAGIRKGGQSGNTCTSAFTARMPSGEKGSITAGHCYNDGHNIYSGNEFYGVTAGEHGFPTFDMIRIRPNGEGFGRRIHVDPCCPVVRDVLAASNPNDEQFICISGMVTRAVCGIEVRNRDATLCDSSGCTPNLIHAKKTGAMVATSGDSGAPIYNRFGDNGAAIRGMHIGHVGEPDDTYFHRVSAIQEHLNVSDIAQ